MKRPLLYTIILIFLALSGEAQNFSRLKFASVSLGNSVIDELLPEGTEYTPLTMLGSTTIWHKGKFTVYGEVQLVQAINNFYSQTDYEFGSNLGIMFQQLLVKNVSVSAAIGSGPHYVTIDTRRQADGFIFSDNFEIGFNIYIPSVKTTLNLKSRYRHISNAGLQEPNGGIDNLFVILGISTVFK